MRGFNRQQVMEYMARTHELLTTLERQLAVARADGQRARAGAEAAVAEAERLRAQVEELNSVPKPQPVHAELSDRMAQILRLANEEAEQERSRASDEIIRLRQDTQAEAERIVTQARAEAEREVEQARGTAVQELNIARDTASRELADARQTAEHELNRARAEAEITITSARTEADQLRLDSVRHAEHLIDDAQRRSGAVNGLAAQRLDALTGTHGEAVSRLAQIRDVLSQLLVADASAGSLSAAVEAAMNNRDDLLNKAESEAVEGEIYDEALPPDLHEVHEVIDVRDDSFAHLRDPDADLNIDPRDPLGTGSIDLRGAHVSGVSVVTGSSRAGANGSH
ncbi:ATP synthase F0 subunit B [Kineosporia succinea]|uniref:F0F1-type ATP synthase membrane subunit b/b n=1 Tax=Kineosporia succinea TaxID=84632 RepID=A0ABT9P427_9ACTN|nr:ATP synthase F0 subunit B [Kineosporia succinea]MDP9827451.1 F0F1-type ATP synthase membrane subunit b/b' [Kineosporia succinea]